MDDEEQLRAALHAALVARKIHPRTTTIQRETGQETDPREVT